MFVAAITIVPAVLLVGLFLKTYLQAVAFFPTQALRLLSDELMIRSSGNGIAFEYSGIVRLFPVSVDIYDITVFAGLMAASMRRNAVAAYLAKFLVGLSILFLLHVLFTIAVGIMIVYSFRTEVVSAVLWIMRFLSMIAPIALWLVFTREPGTRSGWNGKQLQLQPEITA